MRLYQKPCARVNSGFEYFEVEKLEFKNSHYDQNIFSEIYLGKKIYLVKYIFIDFTHNMEYIKCREVNIMSDFQSFLDKTLTQIDVEAIKEEDNEVYEYDIYREIRELVVAARGRAGLTQKEMAAKSGLTQSNISNIEKDISIFMLKAEIRQNIERKEVSKKKMTNESDEAVKRQAKSTKVGRNDPCPCGSGKKYKQCCGK